ncbi:MAG: GNAT family N-acetyltransferase [Clostridiales bacterium]
MLETQRLLIRKFLVNDYNDLYEYLSLDSTYIYEPGTPISLETTKLMVLKRSRENNFFAVELKSEKKVIGHIYFQQLEPRELMTWEIGYIFNPNYHRLGYATESSKELILYGFNNLNIHRIIGRCNPKNKASWKVLEKLGMKREGRFRENIFFKKDKNNQPIWTDTYEYAILSRDIIS